MGKITIVGEYHSPKIVFTDSHNVSWMIGIRNITDFNRYGLIYNGTNFIDKLGSSMPEDSYKELAKKRFKVVLKEVLDKSGIEMTQEIEDNFMDSKLFERYSYINKPIYIRCRSDKKTGLHLYFCNEYDSREGVLYFESSTIDEGHMTSEFSVDDKVIEDMIDKNILVKYRNVYRITVTSDYEIPKDQMIALSELLKKFTGIYDGSPMDKYRAIVRYLINPYVLEKSQAYVIRDLAKYLANFIGDFNIKNNLIDMFGDVFDEEVYDRNKYIMNSVTHIQLQLSNILKDVAKYVSNVFRYIFKDLNIEVVNEVIDFNKL